MSSEKKVQSLEHATRTVIERFNEASNRHVTEAIAALVMEDTFFEDTSP